MMKNKILVSIGISTLVLFSGVMLAMRAYDTPTEGKQQAVSASSTSEAISTPSIPTQNMSVLLNSLSQDDKRNSPPPLRRVSTHALYIKEKSVAEMEKYSDLIIVATVLDDLQDRESTSELVENTFVTNFASYAKVKIKRVIKKPDTLELKKGNAFSISEDVLLTDDGNGGKVKLVRENYQETKKGVTYVLFLKKNVLGKYHLVNFNLGKYNTDGADPDDSGDDERPKEKAEKSKFKGEIWERYKESLKDIG